MIYATKSRTEFDALTNRDERISINEQEKLNHLDEPDLEESKQKNYQLFGKKRLKNSKIAIMEQLGQLAYGECIF